MSHVTADAVITGEDETTNDGAAELSSVVGSVRRISRGVSARETRESFHDAIFPESLTLVSSGSCVCRICHTNTSRESLISPCRCKGTLAYVHLSCLERWLNQSCRNHCELCRYHFNAVETPRYRWYINCETCSNACRPESLRIWISHPRNRRHVRSDLHILTLLTAVTMGLVTVCVLGMQYFVIEGRKIGISRLWTKVAISFFLVVIVLGYATTVYLLAKDQVSPWYRWWKSTVNVRLVMEQQQPRQAGLRNFDGELQPFADITGSRVDVETGTRAPPDGIDPALVPSTSRISEGQRSTIRESELKA